MPISNNQFAEIPEQAKTDLQISNLVTDFYQDAKSYHDTFFNNLIEAYGFYDGSRQWHYKDAKGEIRNVKQEIEQQGKIPLTHNMVFPLVNLVQGIQNDSRLSVKAAPRGGEDTAVGEGMSELLRWVWDGNKIDRILSQAFLHGNICGRGWIGVEQVEDDLDIFATKIQVRDVDAAEIMHDPQSRQYDLSDAQYLIRRRQISRSLARLYWPDKEYELSQYYNEYDSKHQSDRQQSVHRLSILKRYVEILECYYRVYELRTLMFDAEAGLVHDVTDLPPEQVIAIARLYPNVEIIRKKRQVMKYARTAGSLKGVTLEADASPYDDNYFPYVPYFAYHTRDLDFGIPYQIMDAQREINKGDTQILHYINNLPKTKVITDNPEDADAFEQGRDITVLKGNYKIIEPPQFPLAFAQRSDRGMDKAKRISGISDDLRGLRAGGDSGVVVDIRRQQSLANISSLFDNLQWMAENISRLITSRIRQFMSEEHIGRVLGQKATPELVTVLKRLDVETYDFAIAQSPSSPTMRAENWAKIKDLMTIMPLPPDIVIEASDVVQKDQLLAMAKEAQEKQAQLQQLPAGGGLNQNAAVPQVRSAV